LSTVEKQHERIVDDESEPMRLSISEMVTALLQRRRFLAVVIGIGLLLSIGAALLTPNVYMSTVQLMPPDPRSLASVSMLNALTGAGYSASSSLGSMLMVRAPGETFIGILKSRTTLDDLINRFDLQKVYRCKFRLDARKRLEKETAIQEDSNSGLITISVTDRDPNRARDIAGAYVEELDKLVNGLSTSSARRERIFLEQRLKSVKDDLAASSSALSQFSSHNSTFDVQKQGEAMVEAEERLQGELIVAQGELSGLKAKYADDNVRVRQASGRVDELQRQLRKMGGLKEDVNGAGLNSDQSLPSRRKLPLLGVTYYSLYRQVSMQETIYETLSKQYELAKVEEAKEIPTIKVLDEPELPERKSSPNRKVMVFLGALASAFAGMGWIIVCEVWKRTDDSHPAKVIGLAVVRLIRRQNPAMTS
jgi:capsule polysaccharide export protein KpsE/RkpR